MCKDIAFTCEVRGNYILAPIPPGFEINPEYCELANKRIEKTRLEMSQMELAI